MELDAVFLSRLQFAFTVAFHIIFPTFTIGLSAYIATLLVMWRRTGVERYRTLARFWTRIFAVSFAMGVVSGIVLSYQFGTNWSRFSEVVGNVVGPLIGYEVLTAFFLEATFLGVMLFGWKRVPPWLHVLSAILVAIGTVTSAFWIISANSWMQYPGRPRRARRHRLSGRLDRRDLQSDLRLAAGPHGDRRLPDHRLRRARRRRALSHRRQVSRPRSHHAEDGHRHGGGAGAAATRSSATSTASKSPTYQPAKLAAIEAHWQNDGGPAPFVALRRAQRQDRDATTSRLAIPDGGSLLITHSLDGEFPGPQGLPAEDRPPLALAVLRLPHHGRHRPR